MLPRLFASIALVLLVAGPARAQQYIERELMFRFTQYAPSGSLFDSAWGLEGSVRRWAWEPFGYAFSLGLNDYSFASQGGLLEDAGGNGRISGTTGMIPLQASLLWSMVKADDFRLTAEIGLRYNVAITSADVVVPVGGFETTAAIDVADSISAILAVEAGYHAFDSGSVVLGVGLHQDVIQGEYGVNGAALGDAELSAPFVYLALSYDL